jgi:hypothetical protein
MGCFAIFAVAWRLGVAIHHLLRSPWPCLVFRLRRRIAIRRRPSGAGLEVAAPALRTEPANDNLAATRRAEVCASPAALPPIRAVLVECDGLRHVSGLPPGYRGWPRRRDRLRRHGPAGRQRAGAYRAGAEHGAPQEGTAGDARAVRIEQYDAPLVLGHDDVCEQTEP